MSSVVLTLKMDKGGARSALFFLCKRLQWPMPEFEFVEQRFRYVQGYKDIISPLEMKEFFISLEC